MTAVLLLPRNAGLVVWQTPYFPEWQVADYLKIYKATDQAGYSGFKDIVRKPITGACYGPALLGGLITGGVAVAADVDDNSSLRGEAGSQAASNISSATTV